MKIVCAECEKYKKEDFMLLIDMRLNKEEYLHETAIFEYACSDGHKLRIVNFL